MPLLVEKFKTNLARAASRRTQRQTILDLLHETGAPCRYARQ